MPFYNATSDGVIELSAEESAEIQARIDSGAREESSAFDIRAERNNKLTLCDWTQAIDAPIDQAAWATYRQALRDIPSQAGFPSEVTWPTEP
jgi:hypothetical protein